MSIINSWVSQEPGGRECIWQLSPSGRRGFLGLWHHPSNSSPTLIKVIVWSPKMFWSYFPCHPLWGCIYFTDDFTYEKLKFRKTHHLFTVPELGRIRSRTKSEVYRALKSMLWLLASHLTGHVWFAENHGTISQTELNGPPSIWGAYLSASPPSGVTAVLWGTDPHLDCTKEEVEC